MARRGPSLFDKFIYVVVAAFALAALAMCYSSLKG